LLSPGVRPSVTFMYCIQTAKYIIKVLSRRGFHHSSLWLRAPER